VIRHTVSLLTGHIDSLFPKYRGKVLEGEVEEAPGKLSGKPAKSWILRVINKLFFRKSLAKKEDKNARGT